LALNAWDIDALRRKIGVIFQDFARYQLMVGENIGIGDVDELGQDSLIEEAAEKGMANEFIKDLPEGYQTQLGAWFKNGKELSGGQWQKIALSRAFMRSKADVLILDEPTAGVDIELRRSMWDFLIDLNRQGTTIILTTHYLEEAEQLCRNIAIIDNGAIVENTSMKSLLAEIDSQVFVLDVLKADLPKAALCLTDFDVRTLDDQSIEVTVRRGGSINAVFVQLENAGVVVTSMRNKTNRLEQLFINKLTSSE